MCCGLRQSDKHVMTCGIGHRLRWLEGLVLQNQHTSNFAPRPRSLSDITLEKRRTFFRFVNRLGMGRCLLIWDAFTGLFEDRSSDRFSPCI